MLTTYFTRERTRATYAAGPGRSRISMTLVIGLKQRGFTTERYDAIFLGQRSLPHRPRPLDSLYKSLDATSLEAFCGYLTQHDQLRYASGNPTPRCMGAHHFLTFLRAQGVTAAHACRGSGAAFPRLAERISALDDCASGVTEQTLRNYRPILLDLLMTCGERPERLEAKSLRLYPASCPSSWQRQSQECGHCHTCSCAF